MISVAGVAWAVISDFWNSNSSDRKKHKKQYKTIEKDHAFEAYSVMECMRINRTTCPLPKLYKYVPLNETINPVVYSERKCEPTPIETKLVPVEQTISFLWLDIAALKKKWDNPFKEGGTKPDVHDKKTWL